MRDVVLDELNWKEKIIAKVFKKTIIKVYHIARVRTFNELIK
jgi:hypothetical protein